MDKEFGVLYKTHDERVFFSSFINDEGMWFPAFPHTEIDFPMEHLAIEVVKTEMVLVEVLRKEDAADGETTTYLKTIASLDFDDGVEIAIARAIVEDSYKEMFDEIYSSLIRLKKDESIHISPNSKRRLH